MNRLTWDGTAEPVSRDQIFRHARGQGNVHFPCSAYPVDPHSAICDDHTYIRTYTLKYICAVHCDNLYFVLSSKGESWNNYDSLGGLVTPRILYGRVIFSRSSRAPL